MFLGACNDSGRGPGLEAVAKFAVLSPSQERFVGQYRKGLPDPRSGLRMGDFSLSNRTGNIGQPPANTSNQHYPQEVSVLTSSSPAFSDCGRISPGSSCLRLPARNPR